MPTFFFFNDTATTEIYTLSLHDALPISSPLPHWSQDFVNFFVFSIFCTRIHFERFKMYPCTEYGKNKKIHKILKDRKSTRLNSSHLGISYALFCLKKNIIPPDLRPRQPN